MDNYKVKVNNEAESREVQELFFELGYEKGACSTGNYPAIIVTGESRNTGNYCSTRALELNHSAHKNHKELTIPQLRDMFVLKRNDVGDATHENSIYKYFKGCDDWYYFDLGCTDKWQKSAGGEPSYYENLKPIERKEMKEFLVNHDGKWTLQLLDSDTEENSFRVAVPSEADVAVSHKNGNVYFWKDNGLTNWVKKELDFLGRDNGWYECNSSKLTTLDEFINEWVGDAEIIWQRSETESLNDTYAEIEQVRQETVKVTIDELKHRVYKKDVSHLDSIDVYRVLELFSVQSHAVGHAIKKLLCSGGRGAKDEAQDIQEAIDSLIRYQEMKDEDS